MNKSVFLSVLEQKLSFLSSVDLNFKIAFYKKKIEDMISNGLSEEEAVDSFGNLDDLVETIRMSDKLVEKKEVLENSVLIERIIFFILLTPFVIFLLCLIGSIAFSLVMCIVGFLTSSIGVFFSTMLILESPIPTILFNIGLGFGFLFIGLFAIYISYYFVKYGYQFLKEFYFSIKEVIV